MKGLVLNKTNFFFHCPKLDLFVPVVINRWFAKKMYPRCFNHKTDSVPNYAMNEGQKPLPDSLFASESLLMLLTSKGDLSWDLKATSSSLIFFQHSSIEYWPGAINTLKLLGDVKDHCDLWQNLNLNFNHIIVLRASRNFRFIWSWIDYTFKMRSFWNENDHLFSHIWLLFMSR